ncbi:cyanate permease [Pseudarthrobacter sp. W1I19]|nr:hypothetical protein [Pseudarthrobacter sp. W1I19]MDQ0923864.1 cyanate permease [Pseudarthrobacter sp. W1I19]
MTPDAQNMPERASMFGFVFIGVLHIAVKLRVPFDSVGPVLANISSDL